MAGEAPTGTDTFHPPPMRMGLHPKSPPRTPPTPIEPEPGSGLPCSHHHQPPQSGARTGTAQGTTEEECSALPVPCAARRGGGRRSKAGRLQGAPGMGVPNACQVLPAMLLQVPLCATSCDFRGHGCHRSWSSTLRRSTAGLGPPHRQSEKGFSHHMVSSLLGISLGSSRHLSKPYSSAYTS